MSANDTAAALDALADLCDAASMDPPATLAPALERVGARLGLGYCATWYDVAGALRRLAGALERDDGGES